MTKPEPVAWLDPQTMYVCRSEWLLRYAGKHHRDIYTVPLYTASALADARRDALEEAAAECESWGNALDPIKWPSPYKMATAIRALIEETSKDD